MSIVTSIDLLKQRRTKIVATIGLVIAAVTFYREFLR